MSYDDISTTEDDEARRRAIEEMMRLDRPRYFRDEAVQQEYRDILDRQEERQQGRERLLLAPGADQNPVSLNPADLRYLEAADSERIDDPRVLSDVTPDNDWTPGAQYAARRKRPRATGGVYEEDGRDYYRNKGHHEMPVGVYKHWNLQPETAKVFKDSTTGRLRGYYREYRYDPKTGNFWGPRRGNIWDGLHRAYNDAVIELSEDFLRTSGLHNDVSKMTPKQALDLLKLIRESEDPRIRDFNYNIRRIQRLFRLRSGSSDD